VSCQHVISGRRVGREVGREWVAYDVMQPKALRKRDKVAGAGAEAGAEAEGVPLTSTCPRSGHSLLRSGKIEDITNVTLIKNTTVYKNVTILSALYPACNTIYHVDYDIDRFPDGGRAQVYLNSASYLKIGHRIWIDCIFSSSVLKGMYTFHASATAYMDFWNLSYAFNNSASSFIIS